MKCSATYMHATRQGIAEPGIAPENMHMFCPKCGCPAMMEYWETLDMSQDGELIELQNDQLCCPNCNSVVKIGEWHEGEPKSESQKCLMCEGTGAGRHQPKTWQEDKHAYLPTQEEIAEKAAEMRAKRLEQLQDGTRRPYERDTEPAAVKIPKRKRSFE